MEIIFSKNMDISISYTVSWHHLIQMNPGKSAQRTRSAGREKKGGAGDQNAAATYMNSQDHRVKSSKGRLVSHEAVKMIGRNAK